MMENSIIEIIEVPLTKPYAPGGTTMNETYEGLKIVYTKDESEYTKRAAKVENRLGQQLVD
jgi:hypothetical protein